MDTERLHKTNIIILWTCAAILITFITVSRGLNAQTIKSDFAMLIGMGIVTCFYLAKKASDVVRGTGITVIIAIGCILTSVSEGGNAVCFVLSYIPLGMALVYFNPKIIISFLAIYVPICVILMLINPAFIVGKGGTLAYAAENIFSFFVVGIMMMIATKRGGYLIVSTQKMLEKIKEDADNTAVVIEQLNDSMEGSSEDIGELTEQIQNVSDATYEIETLAKTMNDSAMTLNSLFSDTVNALSRNVKLNSELGTQFSKVGEAVENGSVGAEDVRNTLDTMKDTVLAAGEATDVLLNKISSVSSILKEIQKITLRTNMLSINAAIEAAKAGANGKGFAVVASEIKGLANESSDSAASIQQIIAELEKQVDDVAVKTRAGTQAAVAGMESVEKLVSILGEIKAANDVVAEVVSEETQTNAEVNDKFEVVSAEISNLVASVESISQSVESVATQIHRQNDSVKSVNEEIVKMKLVTNSLGCHAEA
ncbi:MAG: methyl-accepting chemotaxis protein [Oscillospiraceae bacterium]|jgi:methyl-accepting chemotaxis protein